MLVETTAMYGDMEAGLKMNQLESLDLEQENAEARGRIDAQRKAMAHEFAAKILMNPQQSQM
jgi:hypothetical protein